MSLFLLSAAVIDRPDKAENDLLQSSLLCVMCMCLHTQDTYYYGIKDLIESQVEVYTM